MITKYATNNKGNKYYVRDFVSCLCRIYGTRDEHELFTCIQHTVLEISELAESRDKKGIMIAMAFINNDRDALRFYIEHVVGSDKADDMADAMWCLGKILMSHHRALWHDLGHRVKSMRAGIVPMNWAPDLMKVGSIVMETILSVSMYLSM